MKNGEKNECGFLLLSPAAASCYLFSHTLMRLSWAVVMKSAKAATSGGRAAAAGTRRRRPATAGRPARSGRLARVGGAAWRSMAKRASECGQLAVGLGEGSVVVSQAGLVWAQRVRRRLPCVPSRASDKERVPRETERMRFIRLFFLFFSLRGVRLSPPPIHLSKCPAQQPQRLPRPRVAPWLAGPGQAAPRSGAVAPPALQRAPPPARRRCSLPVLGLLCPLLTPLNSHRGLPSTAPLRRVV